jgi:hypothetical protein
MSEKMPKSCRKKRRIAHGRNKGGKGKRWNHAKRSFNKIDGNN